MYSMLRRVILRKYGSHRCVGSLRSGLLLGHIINCLFKLFIGNIFIVCIFNQLFKLSCGNLSSYNWIICMYSMLRRVVLRHHGLDCSYGCLRSWKILFGVINFLFKLFIGNICIVCIFNKLFDLSCGNLSSLNWVLDLYSMRLRIILFNHRTFCRNRGLRCGILLCCLSERLFVLSRGHFCCIVLDY